MARHDRRGLHLRLRHGLSRMAPAPALAARRRLRHRPHQRTRSRSRKRELVNPWIAILPLVAGRRAQQGLHRADSEVSTARPTNVTLGGMAQADRSRRSRRSRRSGPSKARCCSGILTVFAFAFWKPVEAKFAEGSKSAIAGALLASMNTASEYGFGAVIAALPGFPRDPRRAQGDSQSAGQRSGHRDDAGRHHRFGVRRHEHRAGGDGGPVHRRRERRRHPARSAASRRRRWPAAAWTRCRTTAR